ncbi:MAG: hypothetical protein A2521_03490 [Deltaproteobacteria bacterium RIFOXYD12_FULL_57_12]|nr:MAG: hypothetical protein A2521_03490 [Deltaproteobacteria bacterium RIFOXYD12_FULL_57_12]
MIDQCPHCQNDLNLSEAQVAKIKNALAALPAGKLLKLSCPRCQQPIELRADGTLPTADPAPGNSAPTRPTPAASRRSSTEPPGKPDLGWLSSGKYETEEVIQDIPMALILMKEGPGRAVVAVTFTNTGYQSIFPASAADAIGRMQFGSFAAVVLHSRFEGDSLASSTFHASMLKMSMVKRRYIFYTLIGPEFQTLYDLEALSSSANLVINDRDVNKFGLIFKKAYHDYEKLFDPLLEALAALGRR